MLLVSEMEKLTIYTKPTVKLKLLRLPDMMKTGSEPSSLRISIYVVNFTGNFPLVVSWCCMREEWEMDMISNVNFLLSGIIKNLLKEVLL